MAVLVSEGYVEVHAERHGVGRPNHRYALSAAGDALFPRSYSGYVQLVFRSMESREPGSTGAAIRAMFEDRAKHLRTRVANPDLHKATLNLSPFLANNGFLPEVIPLDDGSCELHLLNCPVLDVARAFPDQCRHELWYLGELLDAQVERTAFRLDGDNVCAYRLARAGAAPL